jgi:hypothetical protein
MANLSETAIYDAGVYQLETTDPLLGGASGVLNSATKNLANRTAYLKAQTDAHAARMPSFARVSLDNEQEIPIDGSVVKILFDAVDNDDDDLWSVADKRFVAPANGFFQVFANVSGADNKTGNEEIKPLLWVKRNGTVINTGASIAATADGNGTQGIIACLIPVTTGQYIELFVGINGASLPTDEFILGHADPGTYRNESCYFHVIFHPTA